MTATTPDRLYELLPTIHRMRDVEAGDPLRALLQVIAEQVDIVEADIDQLYDNWFIETCAEWVVPYIGDLVGYQINAELTAPGDGQDQEEDHRQRLRLLAPRREVANIVRSRRRKGSLALLEELARDVAGWPSRAVEFYPLLAYFQALDHISPARGRTLDLRRVEALERLDGPFDEAAHTVAVGRINSAHTRSWPNIPNVGLFVWRLKPYSITRAPAYCVDRTSNRYTFSILGNDTPLMTNPIVEPNPTHIADDINVPGWIRRRALEERPRDYYGPGKSFAIWRDGLDTPIPMENIVAADLTNWTGRPQREQVAVDPVLGRIVFSSRNAPRSGVWVTYHYGLSDDLGGGEYPRRLRPVTGTDGDTRLYCVSQQCDKSEFDTVAKALAQWELDHPADAVIEIRDSGAYVEQLQILLDPDQRLELRAAEGTRPTIRLLDWYANRSDALRIGLRNAAGGYDDEDGETPIPCVKDAATPEPCLPRVVLDGLLIVGRSVQVIDAVAEIVIRHCTLVPGWALGQDCEPEQETEPSLEIIDSAGSLCIEHSIIGGIRVIGDEVTTDPLQIDVTDSVLDATRTDFDALIGGDGRYAHATLTLRRSTVFGGICTHAIELMENAIVTGTISVARRQIGCVRFSYVTPESRTPRRHHCQPDQVLGAALDADKEAERLRVQPRFASTRYGTPTYARLAAFCAPEIKRGANDESEMGVFHNLYEPQRETNLQTRLEEYVPAGSDAAVIFVT
jgi:hypothetical protein